jgi:hypothetical protein
MPAWYDAPSSPKIAAEVIAINGDTIKRSTVGMEINLSFFGSKLFW